MRWLNRVAAMLRSGSAPSAKNASPGLRSEQDHDDRDHLDRARDRERDQQHDVVDLLDVGVRVGHQLAGLGLVVEREVQASGGGRTSRMRRSRLDAPARAGTRRSGGARCTTAWTDADREDQRSSSCAPRAPVVASATPSVDRRRRRAAGTRHAAATRPAASPARMPQRTIIPRVRAARPRASSRQPAFALRACVVHESPRRVRRPGAALDDRAADADARGPTAPGPQATSGLATPLPSGSARRGRRGASARAVARGACRCSASCEHVDDLVADELLALEQLVAQRDRRGAGCRRAACARRPSPGRAAARPTARASSLASTLPTIPCVTGPASIASNDDERAGHAERADHLRRDARRVRRGRRPGRCRTRRRTAPRRSCRRTRSSSSRSARNGCACSAPRCRSARAGRARRGA